MITSTDAEKEKTPGIAPGGVLHPATLARRRTGIDASFNLCVGIDAKCSGMKRVGKAFVTSKRGGSYQMLSVHAVLHVQDATKEKASPACVTIRGVGVMVNWGKYGDGSDEKARRGEDEKAAA